VLYIFELFVSFFLSRSCLSNLTPTKASSINMLLNIKCPCHDNCEMMPPQLHGNSLLNVIIAIIYVVNEIIKISEAYNPVCRRFGIINIKETMNSVSGNAQAIKEETGLNIGDSAICSLNTAYSISLLMPVYKKSIINSIEIVSTIVALESHENEIIFANAFRF
jgi:hypothetical protein